MHDGASKFVAAAAAVLPAGLRVIEFGSRDVNGSIRDHFKTAGSYLGVDILPGPGVNLIRDAATFDELGIRADVVVCCEMLEHAKDPAAVCEAAYNTLVAGGMFIVTAANEIRKPHSAIDGGALKDGEPYQPITRGNLDTNADSESGFLNRFRATVIREDNEHGDIYALAIK
jgi:hypothetical protein